MAHRRMGGMGGPHRGNRPFSQHQPFQGNNVNPWQGNANNSMNQGLISNPQQLALALTSLLQPQHANPPSLLSMNSSPGSYNQDRDLNRFGNRGRDFRRHEPYNKNRNGWRTLDTKRATKNIKDRKNTNNKKNEKKPEEKKADTTLDENTEEDSETKRDWKAEKNTTEEDLDETGGEEKKDNKDGKYQGVPQKLLNCFVCNKEMWDGESMQKHIRGRAHKQMLNSLEESIHCTVKILRENMRLQEEKKVIEVNRMHRLKKFNRFQEVESHCNMCDLKFLGKILAHRKTEGHQRLKRYLHPNCTICDKEFPSRMEWVEHRLTPEHLRALNEELEKKGGGADGHIIIKEEELDLEPLLDEPLKMECEKPILELTDDMTGLQNLIPAYKKDRPVSTKSLIEFSGFACEICNRSFLTNELAQAHLKTRRHYYAFIDAAKKKYQKTVDEEKKKKDAEKAEKDKDDTTTADESKEGDMYDPEEACNEEEEKDESNSSQNGSQETENEVADVKEEPADEKTEETASPARPGRRAAARGGAGPKSKKARKM